MRKTIKSCGTCAHWDIKRKQELKICKDCEKNKKTDNRAFWKEKVKAGMLDLTIAVF